MSVGFNRFKWLLLKHLLRACAEFNADQQTPDDPHDVRGGGGGDGDGGQQALGVGDVTFTRHGAVVAKRCANLGLYLSGICQIQVGHGDHCAKAGQFAPGGLADAGAAAGDPCRLSLNFHGVNLCCYDISSCLHTWLLG